MRFRTIYASIRGTVVHRVALVFTDCELDVFSNTVSADTVGGFFEKKVRS